MSLSTQTTFDSHSTISSKNTICCIPFPKIKPVHDIITLPNDDDYCDQCHGNLHTNPDLYLKLFPCYYCEILIYSESSYLCTHCATSDSESYTSSSSSTPISLLSEEYLSQTSELFSIDRPSEQSLSSEHASSSEESVQSTHEDFDDP